MSRWTSAFVSLAIIAFSLQAVAADDNLPRNIELKPSAAPAEAAGQTAEDASSGTTTRQIVTEGKYAPPADASKAGAAPKAAPPAAAPAAPTEAAPAAGKAETAPPPPPASEATQPPVEAAVPAPPAPPHPGLKPEEVIVAVQTELKRVGCDPGAIDGAWGGRSREALAAFGHFTKVDVGKLAPTPDVLELIKGKAEVVCAEPAPPEHHAAPAHDDGYGGGYNGGGGGSY